MTSGRNMLPCRRRSYLHLLICLGAGLPAFLNFAPPRGGGSAGPSAAVLAAALAAAPAPANADWFSFVWGLKTDEQVLEQQESEVEEDLKRQPFANFFDRARLLNLEATLKAEEDTVKAEEKDVERSATRGQDYLQEGSTFRKDERRLKGLSRLAERLQFSDQESQELKDLQQKLPR
mmetsp:Transcript_21549/g.40550  ORF Transcript_21549/g.40550 Transcript_21549/m.40550 type:complete len:177 (-) Transcript_21549:167-697(-)